MLFTSSVGVAHSWPANKGLVPETPLSEPQFASDSGYSASKYVVEQVRRLSIDLHKAYHRLRIDPL